MKRDKEVQGDKGKQIEEERASKEINKKEPQQISQLQYYQ